MPTRECQPSFEHPVGRTPPTQTSAASQRPPPHLKRFHLKLEPVQLTYKLNHLTLEVAALGLYALSQLELLLFSLQRSLENAEPLYGNHQCLIFLLQLLPHGRHISFLAKPTLGIPVLSTELLVLALQSLVNLFPFFLPQSTFNVHNNSL